jgi:hypothetical protein
MTCLWCNGKGYINRLGLCMECTMTFTKHRVPIERLIEKVKRNGRFEEACEWHKNYGKPEQLLK